ncbi:NADAR family protein [Allopusillimonas ginsengisoli]|uniref:NADAR family protein n=1 Tax=Allopusillimonas ginsengisoli TaxID=453575 RepID=UPI001FD6B4B4|nr:NADAR family protein [Allopusillimonas ginsengisoli]
MTKTKKDRMPSISTADEELATSTEIRFYRSNEKPYGVFSNLFRRTIIFEGGEFPTAEHAYQAGKARKEAVRDWILSAPTPSLVAMAAHGLYTWDIVPNWSKMKFDRMREVLRAKYTQHEDLRALLLSTGEARLVESCRTDNLVNRTWGEVNGKGLNMLGVLLMEIRTELRQAENEPPRKGKAPMRRKTARQENNLAEIY